MTTRLQPVMVSLHGNAASPATPSIIIQSQCYNLLWTAESPTAEPTNILPRHRFAVQSPSYDLISIAGSTTDEFPAASCAASSSTIYPGVFSTTFTIESSDLILCTLSTNHTSPSCVCIASVHHATYDSSEFQNANPSHDSVTSAMSLCLSNLAFTGHHSASSSINPT